MSYLFSLFAKTEARIPSLMVLEAGLQSVCLFLLPALAHSYPGLDLAGLVVISK